MEVRAASSARMLRDLAQGGGRGPTVGYVGAATAQRLGLELLADQTFRGMMLIPYSSSQSLRQDLFAGTVDAMISALPEALPYLRSGQTRALAITSAARMPVLPDVPTLSEQAPGLTFTAWMGVFVPMGTSPNSVLRARDTLRLALGDPDLEGRVAEQGAIVVRDSVEDFVRRLENESQQWTDLIRRRNINLQ